MTSLREILICFSDRAQVNGQMVFSEMTIESSYKSPEMIHKKGQRAVLDKSNKSFLRKPEGLIIEVRNIFPEKKRNSSQSRPESVPGEGQRIF